MCADGRVMPLQERDRSIDLLRCIALIGIVFAHVSPPGYFIQMRGFDVPLMVFLSGFVFGRKLDFHVAVPDLLRYWFHRIKRIAFPVWLFFILYYALMYALFAKSPSVSEVLGVFSLRSDAYVWIFRVFLIVALAAPFLTFFTKRIPMAYVYSGGVLILLLMSLIPGSRYSEPLYYVLEAIPYIIVFLFGMLARKTSKKQMVWMALAWLAVYAMLAVWYFKSTGQYVNTNTYKYPPRIYYLAYGLGCIYFFWLLKDRLMDILNRAPFLEKILVFIGSHSMWIYLWHILFLEFMSPVCAYSAEVIRFLHIPFWFARFVFVFFASCCMTFIQTFLVTRLCSSYLDNKVFKWFRPVLVG